MVEPLSSPISGPGVTAPTPVTAPRTPERIAAEKEVAIQIMNSDNSALSKIEPSLSECVVYTTPGGVISKKGMLQLKELYKKADELGYKEVVTFLTPYIKI